MKTLVLSIIVIITASISNAQHVNIPDTAFLYALIDEGVDTNGDSLISYAEAEAITQLELYSKGISDLTGIESFTAIEYLDCNNNQLASIDVSNNTALTSLWCSENQLTTLDVSNNTDLERLGCSNNQLTTLDVTKNTALAMMKCSDNQLTSLDVTKNPGLLYGLWCYNNQLTSLDVTKNTALESLWCSNNELTSLNVSKNPALIGLWCGNNQLTSLDLSKNTYVGGDCGFGCNDGLDLSYMPSLHKVCVWTTPFPPDTIDVDTTGSPNVYFTTDCAVNISDNYQENSTIDIYPNPATEQLTIEFNNVANQVTSIILYDITGKLVYSENPVQTVSSTHTINLSSLREGLYFLHISNDQYLYTEKVIKVE